ncbi:unnamed protein product [Closterium sp. Naga37s-1]|nr:unnamed protein product [Closterium sp. Naga37s-1]
MDPLLADLLEEAIDEPVELQVDSSTEMNSADTSSAGQGLTGGGTSMDLSTDSDPETSLDASAGAGAGAASAGASAGFGYSADTDMGAGNTAGLGAIGSGDSSLGIAELGLNGGSGWADLGVEEFLRGLDGLDNAFGELEDMFPVALAPTPPPASVPAAAGTGVAAAGGSGGNSFDDMLVDNMGGAGAGAGAEAGAAGAAGAAGEAGVAAASGAGGGSRDADMVAFASPDSGGEGRGMRPGGAEQTGAVDGENEVLPAAVGAAAAAPAAGIAAAEARNDQLGARKAACCVGPDSWGECAKKGDPIGLLVSVAKAIVSGDQARVHQLLSSLNEVASVYGTVTQRLSAYFLEGLIARVAGAPPKHSPNVFERFDASSGVLRRIGGEERAGGAVRGEEEECREGRGDGAGFGRVFVGAGEEVGNGSGGAAGEMEWAKMGAAEACGELSDPLSEEARPFEQRQEAGELMPGEAAVISSQGTVLMPGGSTGLVVPPPAYRGVPAPVSPPNVDCNRTLLESFQVLVNATPFLTFGQVAANSAILEALADEPRVHIIDFGIGHALQWPALLQALGARPGGPPHVRVTGIEVPQCGAMSPYCAMKAGKRLEAVAAMWRVPLQYHWVMSRLEDVTPAMLNLHPGEAIAANCALRLSQLLDESEQPNAAANPATAASTVFAKPVSEPASEAVSEAVSDAADRSYLGKAEMDGSDRDRSYLERADLDRADSDRSYLERADSDESPRMRVLRTIRMLRPKVVTVVEQYSNHSSPFFLSRFYEALYYYAALFESIDASLPRNEAARRVFEEQVLGRAIVNLVACEGQERVERQEPLEQWQQRMLRAGFKPRGVRAVGAVAAEDAEGGIQASGTE